MTWFLDLRADGSGGGVAQGVSVYRDDVPMSFDDFEEACRNHDLLFATHGFNVNRARGRQALKSWEAWQTLAPSVLYVGVLWPGDSAWIPAIDYPIEGDEAISSGNLLAAFILDHAQGSGSLSFASHSLGARMVLQTIRGIQKSRRVAHLMLMAGAIDDTCLGDEYRDAAAVVDRVSVLSSYHDQVLHWAFPFGNFLAGIVTRDCPYWHAALGREGPASTLDGKVEQGWQIPDPWHYGHHHYLASHDPVVPARSPPEIVPPIDTPVPGWATYDEWQSSWSAAVLSTRMGET
jgi:hypothetical protein